jgi:hypothetical protein
MKLNFLILFCLCSVNIFAQQTVKTVQKSLSGTEFLKAKNQFITMFNSEHYQSKLVIEKKIIGKLTNNIPREYIDDIKWLEWLTNNIKRTKFVTIEEGVTLRQKYLELVKKVVGENEELFELMSRASQKQIFQITEPERGN